MPHPQCVKYPPSGSDRGAGAAVFHQPFILMETAWTDWIIAWAHPTSHREVVLFKYTLCLWMFIFGIMCVYEHTA